MGRTKGTTKHGKSHPSRKVRRGCIERFYKLKTWAQKRRSNLGEKENDDRKTNPEHG